MFQPRYRAWNSVDFDLKNPPKSRLTKIPSVLFDTYDTYKYLFCPYNDILNIFNM